MKLSLFAASLLPLVVLAGPIATPVEAELANTDNSQSGTCLVKFTAPGRSVSCNKAAGSTENVYRYTTSSIKVECYATAKGTTFYRTVSPNGICWVGEEDLFEGQFCRTAINNVIC